MRIFPEGDLSSSPGLLYSATLGRTRMSSATPTGLWPSLPAYIRPVLAFIVERRRNPVRVARIIAAIPKVAEYSNLGLWASTTAWLFGEPFLGKLNSRLINESVLPTTIISIFH